MTPDEKNLLSGLFDRVKTASNQPRDREAEAFITDSVRNQPYAPYLLAQTVIVQEEALRAANQRLQELEARVQQAEANQQRGGASAAAGSGGFLGGLGSLFGGGQQGQQPAPYAGQGGGFGQGQQAPQGGGFAGGPWGGQGQAAPQGGGFLRGALGMAAGVAGGALLGNAISGLFHGNNNPFGIASGMPGMGGGGFGGGETIVNNYYEGGQGGDAPPDWSNDGGLDQADFDGGSGYDSDDSYNV